MIFWMLMTFALSGKQTVQPPLAIQAVVNGKTATMFAQDVADGIEPLLRAYANLVNHREFRNHQQFRPFAVGPGNTACVFLSMHQVLEPDAVEVMLQKESLGQVLEDPRWPATVEVNGRVMIFRRRPGCMSLWFSYFHTAWANTRSEPHEVMTLYEGGDLAAIVITASEVFSVEAERRALGAMPLPPAPDKPPPQKRQDFSPNRAAIWPPGVSRTKI